MTAPQARPGDTFLLFHKLPYDFKEDLPLPLGPNVYLDKAPFSVLDTVDPRALADYVLPGYHLPSLAVVNCCLRSPADGVRPFGLGPRDLLFVSIAALRLRAPIGLKIVGQFDLCEHQPVIRNPTLFHLVSPWQPDGNARYSAQDMRLAAQIAERQIKIAELKCRRLTSALVLFSQVTCGHSRSFQMAYLALFAALEALFAPQGNKAKNLAARTENFLSPFKFPEPLSDWLEKEYKAGRSGLVHGVRDVVPWEKSPISEAKANVFGRLHELTRLCILGFVSLDDDKLASLSRTNGKQLQKEMDNLRPAAGRFLEGQRVWCVS